MTTETTFYPSGEVKGLTDRPRLTRLGKLRLGIKKQSAKGNSYPSAVDYIVTPPEVQAVYGEKPRELDIVFPSDDVATVAPVAFKMYSLTRGKVCTSDGETAIRIVDDEILGDSPTPTQDQLDRALVKADTKVWSRREIRCPAEECRFFEDGQCKPVMNLQVMLPKVKGLGVYQLDTSSINSIRDVRGGIELVKRVTGGRLAGVPLKLRVKPTEVHPDGKKKTVHTLQVVALEKLETIAGLGEKTLHDILLPLTEGREPPAPAEPEEDLFPDAITVPARSAESSTPPVEASAVRAAAGNARTSSGGSSESRSERGVADVEVVGSTPTPRSDEAMEAALTAAARVEELFVALGTPDKERAMFRKAYQGPRVTVLITMLEKTLATRKAKA